VAGEIDQWVSISNKTRAVVATVLPRTAPRRSTMTTRIPASVNESAVSAPEMPGPDDDDVGLDRSLKCLVGQVRQAVSLPASLTRAQVAMFGSQGSTCGPQFRGGR
jgi:hypothetical protein